MELEPTTSFRPPPGVHGVAARLRHVLYRLSEHFVDWRYGIRSDAEVKTAQFGVTDPACHHYTPINFLRFRQIMREVPVRAGEDVFVDYGSGMGRAVILAAATYPFRRVLGVELSPELHAIAQENVRRARPRLRCRDVALHAADARAFPVPPDVTVFFFYQPFGPEILGQVFDNIYRSMLAAPREVTIIYAAPDGELCLDQVPALPPWEEQRRHVTLGRKSQVVLCVCRVPSPATATVPAG